MTNVLGKALFGRVYTDVGNTSSDFLIKTRGQVKIQWGNKFIDLIKDGKINVDAKFIFKQDSVGSKDGIYVTDDRVDLVVDGQIINLIGEIGTTYVSFMSPQETSGEQKIQALKNIGFIYENISDVKDVNSGLIYIESEQKLYIIKDGKIEEFKLDIPNPYTKQIIIQKNDQSQGSLVIKGSGENNSLKLDSLTIYSDLDTYFNSSGNYNIQINSNDIITINQDSSKFNNSIVTSKIQSENANSNKGFRLYELNGESTLEIDNLIHRNKDDSDIDESLLYPKYWFYSNNVITKLEEYQTEESSKTLSVSEVLGLNESDIKYNSHYTVSGIISEIGNGYIVLKESEEQEEYYIRVNNVPSSFQYETSNGEEVIMLQLNDNVTVYVIVILGDPVLEEGIEHSYTESLDYSALVSIVRNSKNYSFDFNEVDQLYYNVTFAFNNTYEVGDSIVVYNAEFNPVYLTLVNKEEESEESEEDRAPSIWIASEPIYNEISGKTCFLYKSNGITLLTLSKNNLDIEQNDKIISRYGNLTDLELKGVNEQEEISIEGYGIYSENGAFLNAQYTKDYILPEDDNSSKFASTEWVQNIASGQVNLNLLYTSKTASIQDVQTWITKNDKFKEIIKLAKSNIKLVSAKYGYLTLQPEVEKIHITGNVSAVTEDGDLSLRTLDFLLNPVTYEVSELSSYILFIRYNGYYLSKNMVNNQPEDFTYVGTNKSNTSKEFPYLWYYDGVSWTLVDNYIEDTQEYIFIRSTNVFDYKDKYSNNYVALPGGFLCFVENNNTVELGYGISKYIDISSTSTESDTRIRLDKIKSLLSTRPQHNIKPENNNYPYLWAVPYPSDISDYTVWSKLSNNLQNSTVNEEVAIKWCNCDGPSPSQYSWWNINDGKIVSKYRDCSIGNLASWNDKSWVKLFLQFVISSFLNQNKHLYNNVTGWNFYYQNILINGGAGYLGLYFGGKRPPTTDSPDSIGYYPAQDIYQTNGRISTFGYVVDFNIIGLTIGNLIPTLGMGQDQQPGQVPTIQNFFYNVDFTSYNAHFTDLTTGNTQFINK